MHVQLLAHQASTRRRPTPILFRPMIVPRAAHCITFLTDRCATHDANKHNAAQPTVRNRASRHTCSANTIWCLTSMSPHISNRKTTGRMAGWPEAGCRAGYLVSMHHDRVRLHIQLFVGLWSAHGSTRLRPAVLGIAQWWHGSTPTTQDVSGHEGQPVEV